MKKLMVLNGDVCARHGISLETAWAMIAVGAMLDMDRGLRQALDSGLAFHKEGRLALTVHGAGLIDDILLECNPVSDEDRCTALARQLKDIFPKGKKEGTGYYWAEGVSLIARRIKLFFKKYGEQYSDEDILDAARRYVASFNGTYTYMRLLKYFIFKEKIGAAGDVESDSQLVTWIENKGQEDNDCRDWTAEVV